MSMLPFIAENVACVYKWLGTTVLVCEWVFLHIFSNKKLTHRLLYLHFSLVSKAEFHMTQILGCNPDWLDFVSFL